MNCSIQRCQQRCPSAHDTDDPTVTAFLAVQTVCLQDSSLVVIRCGKSDPFPFLLRFWASAIFSLSCLFSSFSACLRSRLTQLPWLVYVTGQNPALALVSSPPTLSRPQTLPHSTANRINPQLQPPQSQPPKLQTRPQRQTQRSPRAITTSSARRRQFLLSLPQPRRTAPCLAPAARPSRTMI